MKYAACPEALGVSSRGILNYLKAVENSGQEMHGLMLLRHGQVACSMAWSPNTTELAHMLFSLSKSFTSAAAGFAVAEGLIAYDDPVLKHLGDLAPEHPSERLRKVTIHHLLTMSSGLDPRSDNIAEGRDWAKRVLAYDVVNEPGEVFHYNSHGTYLVSAIVQRVTGVPIVEYLQPRLFDKLGIRAPYWAKSPDGVCAGGWGLNLSLEDIAKFGQLLLCDGVWNGERVLPDFFVKTACARLMQNDNGKPNPDSDWAQGYGYQFWQCVGGFFRGDGMAGQLMLVIPEKDAVIAVTACVVDMQKEISLIREHLLPALGAVADGSAPTADTARLQKRLAGLAMDFPKVDDGSVEIREGVYQSENGQRIVISMRGARLSLAFLNDPFRPAPYGFIYGKNAPLPSLYVPYYDMSPAIPSYARYGIQGGKLIAQVHMPQAPYIRRDEITFGDGFIEVQGLVAFANKFPKRRYERLE